MFVDHRFDIEDLVKDFEKHFRLRGSCGKSACEVVKAPEKGLKAIKNDRAEIGIQLISRIEENHLLYTSIQNPKLEWKENSSGNDFGGQNVLAITMELVVIKSDDDNAVELWSRSRRSRPRVVKPPIQNRHYSNYGGNRVEWIVKNGKICAVLSDSSTVDVWNLMNEEFMSAAEYKSSNGHVSPRVSVFGDFLVTATTKFILWDISDNECEELQDSSIPRNNYCATAVGLDEKHIVIAFPNAVKVWSTSGLFLSSFATSQRSSSQICLSGDLVVLYHSKRLEFWSLSCNEMLKSENGYVCNHLLANSYFIAAVCNLSYQHKMLFALSRESGKLIENRIHAIKETKNYFRSSR